MLVEKNLVPSNLVHLPTVTNVSLAIFLRIQILRKPSSQNLPSIQSTRSIINNQRQHTRHTRLTIIHDIVVDRSGMLEIFL